MLRKIFLKKGKERSLIHRHPWVFSGAIAKSEGQPTEGETVEVISSSNEFLALAQYQAGSISLRVISFEKIPVDEKFWLAKLQKAWNLRRELGLINNPETNAFTLVHGEGDDLPGLIIDYYNGLVVMQAHTTGMHLVRSEITTALKSVIGNELVAVYDKSEDLPSMKSEGTGDRFLFSKNDTKPGEVIVMEHGLQFKVDYLAGQKTGFFLDQRENRKLLAEYSEDRKVLNAFAYSGGFSMYALKAGASLVHSVDSSAKAQAWAEENARLNNVEGRHQFYCEDVFDFLKKNTEAYDVMVLDPPAFAKRLSAVKQACSGYQRLNETALRKIKPGGILFTFSCSQAVDRKLFRQVIFASSVAAKRNVKILHQLTQPADHPVSMYHPEGEYLKGLVLFVE